MMPEIVTYPPELLTKKQVAYLLSTSERGVIDLTTHGHLTAVDDGGKWTKYRLSDVREYIANLPERAPKNA